MSLLRRILVFVIGLMLLQGNLAAVMLPCATGHGVPAGAVATSDRDGGATGMAVVHAEMGHAAEALDAAAGGERDHECDHREHPENCVSMVSCLGVGAPADSWGLGQQRPHVALAVAANADALVSRTLLPEVPPPRV